MSKPALTYYGTDKNGWRHFIEYKDYAVGPCHLLTPGERKAMERNKNPKEIDHE